MYVCVKCKQEMRCAKNEVGVNTGLGRVHSGDMYVCPGCECRIIAANPRAIHDPGYTMQDVYVDLDRAAAEDRRLVRRRVS